MHKQAIAESVSRRLNSSDLRRLVNMTGLMLWLMLTMLPMSYPYAALMGVLDPKNELILYIDRPDLSAPCTVDDRAASSFIRREAASPVTLTANASVFGVQDRHLGYGTPPSIWEQSPSCVIAGGLLAAVGGTLIIGLMVQPKQRRRAEQALMACEALMSAALAFLDGLVAVIDQDGVIMALNEAWRHVAREHHAGPAASVSVGANYFDVCQQLLQADDPRAMDALIGIESVLHGHQARFALDYRCTMPDGERWYAMAVEPLRRAEGGAVISHRDTSDRNRTELMVQRYYWELAHLARGDDGGTRCVARPRIDPAADRHPEQCPGGTALAHRRSS